MSTHVTRLHCLDREGLIIWGVDNKYNFFLFIDRKFNRGLCDCCCYGSNSITNMAHLPLTTAEQTFVLIVHLLSRIIYHESKVSVYTIVTTIHLIVLLWRQKHNLSSFLSLHQYIYSNTRLGIVINLHLNYNNVLDKGLCHFNVPVFGNKLALYNVHHPRQVEKKLDQKVIKL